MYSLAPQEVDATGGEWIGHKVSEASACSCSAERMEVTVHIDEPLALEVIEMFACGGDGFESELPLRLRLGLQPRKSR